MRVSEGFQRLLERDRERYNAHFTLAKREHRGLDGEVVLEFLAGTLGPIVEALLLLDPARAPEVALRLHAASLPLLGRDLIGPRARRPALNEGLRLLPELAPRLLEDPERTLRALLNALHHLEQGARPEDWLLGMLELHGAARDLDELLTAGQVLAWRAGMPQLRLSALGVAATLRPEILSLVLGVPIQDKVQQDAILARLRADPWADPQGQEAAGPTILATLGGFRGFGGAFLRPPRVGLVDGALLLSDGESTFTLHADRFGALLQRTLATLPEPAPPRPGLIDSLKSAISGKQQLWPIPGGQVSWSPDGTVGWAGRGARLPELAGAGSVAFDGRTLVVTHPLSHRVFLVG